MRPVSPSPSLIGHGYYNLKRFLQDGEELAFFTRNAAIQGGEVVQQIVDALALLGRGELSGEFSRENLAGLWRLRIDGECA